MRVKIFLPCLLMLLSVMAMGVATNDEVNGAKLVKDALACSTTSTFQFVTDKPWGIKPDDYVGDATLTYAPQSSGEIFIHSYMPVNAGNVIFVVNADGDFIWLEGNKNIAKVDSYFSLGDVFRVRYQSIHGFAEASDALLQNYTYTVKDEDSLNGTPCYRISMKLVECAKGFNGLTIDKGDIEVGSVDMLIGKETPFMYFVALYDKQDNLLVERDMSDVELLDSVDSKLFVLPKDKDIIVVNTNNEFQEAVIQPIDPSTAHKTISSLKNIITWVIAGLVLLIVIIVSVVMVKKAKQ